MQRGYSRSIPDFYRFLRKQELMAVHPPNPKYVPKPYEQMDHSGQRIQIDVKFVPSVCLVNEAKDNHLYQYTAIDEYSRWRFVEAFEEHSSHGDSDKPTIFPLQLRKHGIKHKLIRPFTSQTQLQGGKKSSQGQ